MIIVQKYRVPEAQYLECVRTALANLNSDPTKLILMTLCKKLKSFASSFEDAPVFLFRANDEKAKQNILSCAEKIASQKCPFPKVAVDFLLATSSHEDFLEKLNEIDSITDSDLRHFFLSYESMVSSRIRVT